MRKERFLATALVASAVWIGVLAGCGGGNKEPETPETTTGAAVDTGAAGGAAGEVSLAVGERIVQERCVLCHGESGKGDGPGGAALNPKPRDWTDHTYMGSQTDDQLFQVIHDGKGSMPAWGKTGILTDAEIRSAILKVRTYDPQYGG